ncbi:MAG: TlpA family protein disulfide reductase [Anaerolineales bacterium]|nr:TlpA family protein disulfide reductase [Anaerolineales bacterium]
MTTRKELIARRRQQQKINRILLIFGGLLIITAAAILLTDKPSSQASGPAQIGKPLPDFSLTDINGKTVSLSDYAGQVVLINAWATWCPPCKAEMPDLNAYYQAHQDDGFVILAINAGDPAEEAAAFAKEKGLAFPVLLDPSSRLLGALGINSFPTSILVGVDGIVKSIHVGMYSPQALEEEITPHLP